MELSNNTAFWLPVFGSREYSGAGARILDSCIYGDIYSHRAPLPAQFSYHNQIKNSSETTFVSCLTFTKMLAHISFCSF